MINEGGYIKYQNFSVDELVFYWKMMPSRTFRARQEKAMPSFQVQADFHVRG